MKLEGSQQAAVGAAGTAQLAIGPVPWGHRWIVDRVTVKTTSAARTAASLYRNTVADSNLIDSAPYSGNNDTTDTIFELAAGETLIVRWTGGTVGAIATATYSGRQE